MQPTPDFKQEKDPFIQLLILLGLLAGAFILVNILALIIGLLTFGIDVLKDPALIMSTDPAHITGVKIQLIVQQFVLFLGPALMLAIIEKQKPQQFYGMKRSRLDLFFIVFLIMMCSFPIMGWINEQNQKMHLPGFLKNIEHWMREMENVGTDTTEAILKVKSVGGFVFNLIVIAIVPAICEELLFRGALQRTLVRAVKNHHIAIWTSAIIFSAIHLQFFGFFPRLFLGAGFGYIYYWTGSLRYTMFAHFLNNGMAVSVAYYLQINNLPPEKADEINVHWTGYVISAIITLALFKFLKNKATTPNTLPQTPPE
jgi:membrane protease YdiL (CAAX protease family)